MKVSIIVPARNERFLLQTINDLVSKAAGEIEVIPVLDGYVPNEFPLEGLINVHPIYFDKPKGMRAAINAAAAKATGDYLLKADGHCMFQEGYDKILLDNMQDNWIVIPGRHSLDPINWCIQQNGKSRKDYHYLCFPDPNKGEDRGMHGVEWPERSRQRFNKPEYMIDDTPSFQGSCWFMKKTWFTDFLHGMDETGYGSFSQEPQEIGNKTWLGGGEVKVNKNVWYAHLHKGKTYGRMYPMDMAEVRRGHNYSAWFWATNQWTERIHDFKWLVEKFMPMPGWSEDWEKQINDFWPTFKGEGIPKMISDNYDLVEEVLREAKARNSTVYIIGNGGSASTADHFACDLMKKAGCRAISLTANNAVITAYANDCGYEHVFIEQLKVLLDPDDILIAISASGNSINIIRAVRFAKTFGVLTIALTGFEGGVLGELADYNINYPEGDMGMIEDFHLAVVHKLSKSI